MGGGGGRGGHGLLSKRVDGGGCLPQNEVGFSRVGARS